ncbi:glucose PTS transporter subunit IIA [Dorea amylophila]|uniref:EIIBCA-Bgl n=1 Tax=Dorea longicatena TaxID=88431 RepID=A0A174MEC6_9FIRM|nr:MULTISPECIES: PTS transporter subunit IIBCA [Dorea]MCU6740624.1 glucose PTS transporter subunit IIA [Dorea amylophila]CUP33471.1 EIIBCA-Bgl [Dorea longicatena]
MEGKDYRKTAEEIIRIVGKDNIVSATHCATRLRLIVKDKEAIDVKKLEKLPLVKGTFFNAGQFQIILGTGIVNKVYEEIENLGLKTLSKKEQDEAIKNQQKGVKRLMRILGDIFIPIIPVIAATGLFLGLKGCVFNDNVLGLFGASTDMIPDYIVTLVNVLTETAFSFLPAIICWSAFKVFGGTPVIGMVLGLMLVSPILPNAYSVANPDSGISAIMAFGKIPIVGCQGSVLTAIITALIGAKLEKKLRKIMPNALDLIMTPFVVMLVTFLIVILCVGPVMHVVELKLVSIVEALVHLPFGIGGFIIGATYPLLVITGLHHTYTMIETSLLANTGFNPVITLCAMYGFANVGTCLAFFVKSKNTTVRQTSIGAMLSQLFGISEPVLFGIQLRYNLKPLIIMLFTSGLGAASLSLLNIQSNSYGLAVIPSYLMYIYEGRQFLWYLIISICSVALCFVLTYLFGVPEEAMLPEDGMDDGSVLEMEANGEMTNEENREHKESMDGNKIIAPVSGKVIPLEEVTDPTFAGKVLGDGFAIVPEDSIIKSPINGTVELMYETGHAVGLSTDDGKEILIHIGIDTVAMNGDGFHIIAKTGQNVKSGDPLVEVDFEKIRKAGKSDSVIVIVTSGEKVETRNVENVKSGISEAAEIV